MAAILGWAVFSLYWENAAKTAAKAKSSESSSSRGLHVLMVNLALLPVILPIRGAGRYLPESVVAMAVELAMGAAGVALAIWARRHLGRNSGGAVSIKVEHQLVRSGPYRSLRHPIYSGLLLMYIGPAILTGEWIAWIGVALAVFAYWRKVRLEEAVLRGAFGEQYEVYRRETWGLAPRIW